MQQAGLYKRGTLTKGKPIKKIVMQEVKKGKSVYVQNNFYKKIF